MSGRQKGFTLIELLVVISIIGVLSTIAMTSLNGARAKARDVKRLSDVQEVRKALTLYYSDYGSYPGTSNWVSDCSGDTSWKSVIGGALAPYMAVPDDPVFPNNVWPLCYYYKLEDYGNCSGSGYAYTLLFATEASKFNLQKYSVQGEGGTAARFCLHEE
ncbi:MAG: type II secretion system protein [Patescibacteria group bacterium]